MRCHGSALAYLCAVAYPGSHAVSMRHACTGMRQTETGTSICHACSSHVVSSSSDGYTYMCLVTSEALRVAHPITSPSMTSLLRSRLLPLTRTCTSSMHHHTHTHVTPRLFTSLPHRTMHTSTASRTPAAAAATSTSTSPSDTDIPIAWTPTWIRQDQPQIHAVPWTYQSRRTGVIAQKMGMMSIFDAHGRQLPITVVRVRAMCRARVRVWVGYCQLSDCQMLHVHMHVRAS